MFGQQPRFVTDAHLGLAMEGPMMEGELIAERVARLTLKALSTLPCIREERAKKEAERRMEKRIAPRKPAVGDLVLLTKPGSGDDKIEQSITRHGPFCIISVD